MSKSKDQPGREKLFTVAACGLYCGACPIFRACHDEDDNYTKDPEADPGGATTCRGCRSDHLYQGCRDCGFRDCAAGKGLTSCAECPEAPCDAFARFDALGLPHTSDLGDEIGAMRRLGEASWAELRRERWSCGSCRTRFSWYAETCPRCGARLSGFELTPEAESLRPRDPA